MDGQSKVYFRTLSCIVQNLFAFSYKINFYAFTWWCLYEKAGTCSTLCTIEDNFWKYFVIDGQFFCSFVYSVFSLIWIICSDTKYKQYLFCKKLSEPAYKEDWNPNSNHGAEEFERSCLSRTLRKRWYLLKHFSGDHYVVTSSLCALYRVSAFYRNLNLQLPCPRQ